MNPVENSYGPPRFIRSYPPYHTYLLLSYTACRSTHPARIRSAYPASAVLGTIIYVCMIAAMSGQQSFPTPPSVLFVDSYCAPPRSKAELGTDRPTDRLAKPTSRDGGRRRSRETDGRRPAVALTSSPSLFLPPTAISF